MTSSEEVFTYSAAPKFKVSENASLYARIAKGFRPGGPKVIPPTAPASTPKTYDSDPVLGCELGFKGEMADRRFGVAVAVFHIDWKNIQIFAQVNGLGVNINGSGATSDGLEFTATARPVPELSLSVNGAYTEAKLEGDTHPLVGGWKGDRLPFTPELSLALNATIDGR